MATSRSSIIRDSITVSDFRLSSGTILKEVTISYSIQGDTNTPLVIVLGGISATRHVATAPHPLKGWWSHVFTPESTDVLTDYRVFSIDFLGASADSSGPHHVTWQEAGNPAITTTDQANAIHSVLRHLGFPEVRLFVGASYGGMVALKFASLFPGLVRQYIVISAAHRSAPLAVAWRTVQRRILDLSKKAGLTREGVRLARALAMAGYRTPDEFNERFGGPGTAGLADDEAPIWQYLSARGEAYADAMHPDAFFTLSHSIDTHSVSPADITDAVYLLGVDEDQLVPIDLLAELAQQIKGQTTLRSISSIYGHDAFLKETPVIQDIITSNLRSCC